MDNNYNNGQQGTDPNAQQGGIDSGEQITGYVDGPDPNAQQGGYSNNSAPYGQQQGGYQNGGAPYGQQGGYQNGPNPNYYGPQNPYQQQGYQNGPAPNYYGPQNRFQPNMQNPYQAPPQEGSVGMAVASMVLGIVGMLISCCLYPVTIILAIIGLILGAVAIKKGPAGKGMAVTGIVLSVISLAAAVLFIILMAVAGTSSVWDAMESVSLMVR